MKILGEIKKYYPDNGDILIRLSFSTPEILTEIEECIKRNGKVDLNLKSRYKKTKQYFQQKAWYGSLALILKASNVLLTSENLHIEDIEQRESIFPVIEYYRNGEKKYRPKRMSECSFEEMQRNIEILHKRHKHLKLNGQPIDFNNLKLK